MRHKTTQNGLSPNFSGKLQTFQMAAVTVAEKALRTEVAARLGTLSSHEIEKQSEVVFRLMVAVAAAKKALRSEVAARLGTLSSYEIAKQSEAVFRQLCVHSSWRLPLRAAVYLSTATEVSTVPMLSSLFSSGSTVFVPQYCKHGMKMLKVRDMDDVTSLPLTKWKIRQPALNDVREDAMQTGGLDLVIAPGVAFTKDGKRLGHGAGYYDTFLDKLQEYHAKLDPPSRPVVIALALREQIYREVPVIEKDYQLDDVLYPH